MKIDDKEPSKEEKNEDIMKKYAQLHSSVDYFLTQKQINFSKSAKPGKGMDINIKQ